MKILLIFGTRPEAIKMAPIVKVIQQHKRFEPVIVVSGQHREMLDQVLQIFDIQPDYDLNIMKAGQTLSEITSKVLLQLSPILETEQPKIVLVHGDTTTAMAASMAAFYQNIPVGHVEAGLRTWNLASPFPEEANRQIIDIWSSLYFAPTDLTRQNLLNEGKPNEAIYVTGNTAIDALNYTIKEDALGYDLPNNNRNVLVTMHRRENLGKPMEEVFRALKRIAQQFSDVNLIFPVHKNPKVQAVAKKILSQSSNVSLIDPLDVVAFHNLAAKCYLILTDSGGIQEEAPSLGVPVLVLRDTTERPEGVEAGTLKIIGTSEEMVYQSVKNLLTDPAAHKKMAEAKNPYGDGKASERIVDIIESYFKMQ